MAEDDEVLQKKKSHRERHSGMYVNILRKQFAVVPLQEERW